MKNEDTTFLYLEYLETIFKKYYKNSYAAVLNSQSYYRFS